MPGPINVDYLTSEGGVATSQNVVFPLSNWGQILVGAGGAVAAPHTQTGAAATNVATLSLTAGFTGLFECSVRASWSDGTTAGLVTHSLFTKQGAAAGAITGGTAVGKFGAGAASVAAAGGAVAAGLVLNVDAAGGAGLAFEGSGAYTIAQHSDAVGTLTGLLTANGGGTQNFEFYGVIDAVGVSSAVKTPFTLGKPVAVSLAVSSTAAHVITYNSLSMFVRELPVA